MAITINGGTGVITGVSVGGLPDGVVDSGTLATNSVDSAELIDGSIDISHLSITASTIAKGVASTYDVSTASGTQDVTGFGFDPRFVVGFGHIEGTDITFMGWTEVGVLDRCIAERGDNGNSYAQGQFPAAQIDGSNRCNSVVSSITDGVRFTWTKIGSPTGTLYLFLLGLK